MIGSRLKYLRTANKKNQEDVAKYLGVTRPAYSAYENDKRKLDNDSLVKLADYYGVTTDYLLGRTDFPEYNQQQQQEFEQFKDDPELQRFFYELPKSPEEDLQQLKDIWEVIKKKNS